MGGGKFRVFGGRGRRSEHDDGDSAAGGGEALRAEHQGTDEGDERMLELIEQLKAIRTRPDAAEPSGG